MKIRRDVVAYVRQIDTIVMPLLFLSPPVLACLLVSGRTGSALRCVTCVLLQGTGQNVGWEALTWRLFSCGRGSVLFLVLALVVHASHSPFEAFQGGVPFLLFVRWGVSEVLVYQNLSLGIDEAISDVSRA